MFFFDIPAGLQALLNSVWIPLNILLITGLLVIGYLTYRRPALGIAGIALVLPLYFVRTKFSFFPTTYLELTILTIAAIYLASIATSRMKRTPLPPDPLRLPITLLLGAGTLALWWSPDLQAAVGLWRAYLIEPILVYAIARRVLITHTDGQRVVKALGMSAAVLTLVALWQWMTGIGIAEPQWVAWPTRRVTAWYTSPNAVGLYLGPIIALLAGTALDRNNSRKARWLMTAVVIAALFAVAATKSAGTWLGLAAAVGIIGWFTPLEIMPRGSATGLPLKTVPTKFPAPSKFLTGLTLGRWRTIIIAGVASISLLLVPGVRTRVAAEFRDPGGQNRISLWRGTTAYLLSTPANFFRGGGIHGFSIIHETFRNPRREEPLIYPHQIVLNFWIEYGFFGLLAMTWIALSTARRSAKTLRKNFNGIQLGALAGLGAMFVHGLVDVPYFKNDLAVLVWVFIFLALQKPSPLPTATDKKIT